MEGKKGVHQASAQSLEKPSRINIGLKIALCICSVIAICFLVAFIVVVSRNADGTAAAAMVAVSPTPLTAAAMATTVTTTTPLPQYDPRIATMTTTTTTTTTATATTTITTTTITPKSNGTSPPNTTVPSTHTNTTGVCMTPSCIATASRVLAALNQSVSPCEDFYQYACGGWIQDNPVPSDKPSVSVFTWIGDQNVAVVRELLANNISTPMGAQVSRLYLSCLNTGELDARGNTPLVSLFEILTHTFTSPNTPWDQDTDSAMLAEMLAELHLKGIAAFFLSGVAADRYNSSVNSFRTRQGGLTIPSRDYYVKSAATEPLLNAFQASIATSFRLMGTSAENASLIAARVLALETRLAEISMSAADMRDPVKQYNPRNVTELNTECPAIRWDVYFATIYGSTGRLNRTISTTPSFFQNLTAILTSTPKTTIIEYLQAQAVTYMSSFLSKPFRDNQSQFHKALYGTQQDPEWWRTCVAVADGIGFAVGQAFAAQKLSQAGRGAAEEILNDVSAALLGSFANLSWMDAPTAAGARSKASKITRKIGYPQWFDDPNGVDNFYSGLNIGNSGFYEEIVALAEWGNKKNYMSVIQPVDRAEWEMFPQDVDAYYKPSANEIVFPAGILQPPFFSLNGPKSLNYGGIGSIMGHEHTHAFDDQGAQYDAEGNLGAKWRTDSSYELFTAQTACLVKEYGNFTVQGPSGPVQVNGQLTLGENIADNGGLKTSFAAYRSWVARNSPELKLPGLDENPEQLFFLGFAQAWCSNSRPDYLRLNALSDPHSPSMHRVNGVVMNSRDFASAYQCPVGSRMNPVEKCAVW